MRALLGSALLGASCVSVVLAAPPDTLTGARLESSSSSPAATVAASGAEAEWLGWLVPAVAGAGDVCCYAGNGKAWHRRGCSMEKGSGEAVDTSDAGGAAPAREVVVLVRAERRAVTEVRALSATCPGSFAGRRLIWFEGVDGAESVRFLRGLVTAHLREGAVEALALHADPAADRALEEIAALPGEAREDAIFWLGEARGRSGLGALRKLLLARPDGATRAKIAFALAQSKEGEAVDDLVAMAHSDPSADTRSEALFWLAQRGGERAEAELLRAVDQDAVLEVRKKAVFALSQLDHERATPLLLQVLKGKSPAGIRREALFWLGQSDDPKAQDALEAVLLR